MHQGYHGTGLKEILDAVNIPKGSFYNYFGSKENFAAEIIHYYIQPFIRQLEAYLIEYQHDAFLALQNYFDALIVSLEAADFKGGCLLGNLMGELADSNEICRNALQDAVSRYRDLLAVAIDKAQQQNTIRSDKSANELADLLLNSWQGALLRMKIERSSLPLRQIYQTILSDFFIRAC